VSASNSPTLPVTAFTGINNKADPETLGLGAFVAADNVDVDATGKHLFARDGKVSLSSTAYVGAYATIDARRCYAMTAAGDLVSWNGTANALRSGFVGYPYWCQVGDIVFVGNENQCWRIRPDNTVEDNAIAQPAPLALTPIAGTLPPGQYRFTQVNVTRGRESAPSVESIITVDGTQNIQVSGITGQRIYVAPADSQVFGWWLDTTQSVLNYARSAESLGEELRTNNLQPLPAGRCLALHQGRLYCSVYDPVTDQSVIWRSLPLWWDLCEPADMKLVPGEVRAMAGLPAGLVIATDRQLFVLTDDALTTLADYGVPPGQSMVLDVKIAGEEAKECWIWTARGVCKALPFLEVAPQFAPPGSDFIGTAIVRRHGDDRLIATLSPNGAADNPN
jgi:hypothetical protein